MVSTKQKYKHPLLTRRVALTTPPGVISQRAEYVEQPGFKSNFRKGGSIYLKEL